MEVFKGLRRQAGFSAAVVMVLGVCMGLNSALFTVIDSLWLKPLPFPHSERLVDIPDRRLTPADLHAARSVESAGAYLPVNLPVAGSEAGRSASGWRWARTAAL